MWEEEACRDYQHNDTDINYTTTFYRWRSYIKLCSQINHIIITQWYKQMALGMRCFGMIFFNGKVSFTSCKLSTRK